MKFVKYILILLFSFSFQLYESWQISLDNHHGTMLLAIILVVNTPIFFLQLLYYFFVRMKPNYKLWFDYLFYFFISILSGCVLYLFDFRLSLFGYLVFLIIIDILVALYNGFLSIKDN